MTRPGNGCDGTKPMNVQRALQSSSVPVHDALKLTAGGNTAVIVLDGQIYTLRITRAGKLILNK